MRVTGVGVALIGAMISAYCAIMFLVYSNGGGDAPGEAVRGTRTAYNLIFPMMVSGVAISIGVGMALFGDKGFKFSRNLSERN